MVSRRQIVVLVLGSLLFWITVHEKGLAQEKLKYPQTKTIEQVDDFFGTKVADPYRWLEQDVRTSEDVAKWVEAENEVTFGYLKKLPYRQQIEDRLTQLWNFEKYTAPFQAGGRYYYSKNDGLQNQYVVYRLDMLGGEPKVLLDPNTWSQDGTVALSGMAFSEDGEHVAYGVAEAGSDWVTWKIMEIESGRQLPDEIKWIKFGGAAWTLDGEGFFYSRYDEPKSDEQFQGLNLSQKVFYHRVGAAQAEDALILEEPEHPDWGFGLDVTEDGKFLVVTVWKGTDDKYRVKYKDLREPDSKFVDLINNFDHEFTFIGNEGDLFYFRSDWKAPKKAVVAIDITKPQQNDWRVIIPEAPEVLDEVSMVGDMLITQYLQDAKTQVKLFALNGEFIRQVELPGIGTASGFGGKRKYTETFYSFSSFNTPPSTYRYELSSGKSQLLQQAKVDFDSNDYEVKQIFYTSKDGTKVPMFIAHKKGLQLNGDNPTLLYGYGGFNIPLTPEFSISRLQWMEMGGVFAMPNLRGGGEYGEEWHRAGTKLNKQNVFDDFISSAEWLIENKYCSPQKLAIQGGSNGGLLVGACETQRPDLFGACLPAVGVMDMLRFHKFTAGRFWVDDYGSAEASAEEFKALYAYSPYHKIKDGTEYPPTLISTADTDDRVVPGHSFKFAARLQAAQAGDAPILIRIDTRAGHGAGKPTSKIIEELADKWAFLVDSLGMKPFFPAK